MGSDNKCLDSKSKLWRDNKHRRQRDFFYRRPKDIYGTGESSAYYNDFWEYDPSINTWFSKANFGGGVACPGCVRIFSQHKGYIGIGGNVVLLTTRADFWEWDQATDTWTQKANFGGTARRDAVGFSIGTKGYIGTGHDVNGNDKNDFWEYDSGANTWTAKMAFGGIGRSLAVGFSNGAKGYSTRPETELQILRFLGIYSFSSGP